MENENQVNLPDIIKDRKILPLELKKNIVNIIFFNCIFFIIMMIITLIINVSFNKLSIRAFDSYIDMIQISCAIISVGVLEIAYRKDSGKIGIYGIELLIFSIAVLFVPYMYISKNHIIFLRNAMAGFGVYYFVKSLGTFLYIRHNYLKDNISDIKELVKEDKEGYLDEESTKTLKVQKIENEKRKKVREEKIKKNKINKKEN